LRAWFGINIYVALLFILFYFLFVQIICPSAAVIVGRTCETPLPGSKLISSPEISPIGSVPQRNKSVTRLNFSSGMMSVDSSIFSPSHSPLGEYDVLHLQTTAQYISHLGQCRL
jgi:hypothetical protein